MRKIHYSFLLLHRVITRGVKYPKYFEWLYSHERIVLVLLRYFIVAGWHWYLVFHHLVFFWYFPGDKRLVTVGVHIYLADAVIQIWLCTNTYVSISQSNTGRWNWRQLTEWNYTKDRKTHISLESRLMDDLVETMSNQNCHTVCSKINFICVVFLYNITKFNFAIR